MGKAARAMGISGKACLDDQRNKQDILLFAREFWGDDWARKLGVKNPDNMNEVCEKYKDIFAHPKKYGIENPGSFSKNF